MPPPPIAPRSVAWRCLSPRLCVLPWPAGTGTARPNWDRLMCQGVWRVPLPRRAVGSRAHARLTQGSAGGSRAVQVPNGALTYPICMSHQDNCAKNYACKLKLAFSHKKIYYLINMKGLTKPQNSKPFKLKAETLRPSSPCCPRSTRKGSGVGTPGPAPLLPGTHWLCL